MRVALTLIFALFAGTAHAQETRGTSPLSIAKGGTGGATAAAARTSLGVTATGADTTYAFRANNLSDLASVPTARTNLGVTATGADTTYAFRANNLNDLASASAARTNLGLGTVATVNGGAGVNTALAASLNATGGLVGFNGALGTPTSAVLTNATGLPISSGLAGAGAGVLAALAIPVGTAGAPVVNGGALGSPSSVGTLPAFTLGGTVTGGGKTVNNVAVTGSTVDGTPIGSTTPSTIVGSTASVTVAGVAKQLPPPFPGYQAGVWITGRVANTANATATPLSVNVLYAFPLIMDGPATWTALSVNVMTAGTATLCRLGIFNNDYTDGGPGTLLLDAGTAAVTATGVASVTISQALGPLFYYGVVACNGTVTLTGFSVGANTDNTYLQSIGSTAWGTGDPQISKAFTFGALSGASPFGAVTRANASIPIMAVKK